MDGHPRTITTRTESYIYNVLGLIIISGMLLGSGKLDRFLPMKLEPSSWISLGFGVAATAAALQMILWRWDMDVACFLGPLLLMIAGVSLEKAAIDIQFGFAMGIAGIPKVLQGTAAGLMASIGSMGTMLGPILVAHLLGGPTQVASEYPHTPVNRYVTGSLLCLCTVTCLVLHQCNNITRCRELFRMLHFTNIVFD